MLQNRDGYTIAKHYLNNSKSVYIEVYCCINCGAAVQDPVKHDKWHQDQTVLHTVI